MPKVKYYYDSESLSFKKIKTGKKTVFKNILLFLIGSSFFGFLFIFIGSQYFQSPKERSLNRELDNMKFQFAQIDKKMGNIIDFTNPQFFFCYVLICLGASYIIFKYYEHPSKIFIRDCWDNVTVNK